MPPTRSRQQRILADTVEAIRVPVTRAENGLDLGDQDAGRRLIAEAQQLIDAQLRPLALDPYSVLASEIRSVAWHVDRALEQLQAGQVEDAAWTLSDARSVLEYEVRIAGELPARWHDYPEQYHLPGRSPNPDKAMSRLIG